MYNPTSNGALLTTCIILLQLLFSSHVYSFSSGAGDDACDNMVPGHPTPGDVGTPPFEITLSQPRFKPGEKINVTLTRTDGNSFKGFLLQARRKSSTDNEKIGSFTTKAAGTRDNCIPKCTKWPSCSVTHSNGNTKTNVQFTWEAPCTFEGDVTFRASLVDSYSPSVYWANLPLADLLADPGTGDECQNTTTIGPDVTVTDAPGLPAIDLGGCGTEKGCYRVPSSCSSVQNCNHILTWVSKGTQIEFEMSALTTDDAKWSSLGLSLDQKMGNDSVTDCIYDETSQAVVVQSSWNNDAPNNIVLSDKELGLVPNTTRGSYSNGVLQCSFTRYVHNNHSIFKDLQKKIAVPMNNDPIFDIVRPYYLFLGKGPASSGVKQPHTETPSISPQMVNLSSKVYVNIGGSSKFKLVITHGSMMIFAWMLFASVGVLMPRYFKTAWKDNTFYDKAIWFQIHRPLMTLVLTLTCIGFIAIFVEEGGYSSHLTKADAAHPILGIIVTALVIINPIMAMARPHPDSAHRPIFNAAHFTVGTLSHVSAAVTMFLGTRLSKSGMSDWARWIVLGFVLWHCIVETILAVHQWYMNKNISDNMTKPINSGPIRKLNEEGSYKDHVPSDLKQTSSKLELVEASSSIVAAEKSGSIFKTSVIILHFVVLLSCSITLVVDLAK